MEPSPFELTPDVFRERFALATFPDGGIVVDLATGGYLGLNPAAAILLGALEGATSAPAAAATAAGRLGISTESAASHLRELGTGLVQAEELRSDPVGPFTYRSVAGDGCELWEGERRAVAVDGGGRLQMASPPGSLSFRPFDYVSELVPKLLFSQGVTVLHGSSCQLGEGLLGMCGRSGAGKTTTARTFARHGCPLISEDLLIFNGDLNHPAVFVDAERAVRGWTLEASGALDADPHALVDTTTLAGLAKGRTIPIGTIWFLDVDRRGDQFETKQLSRTGTLERLMRNGFLGGGEGTWRRYLGSLRAIVAGATGYDLHLPSGLDRLDAQIGAYITNSAS